MALAKACTAIKRTLDESSRDGLHFTFGKTPEFFAWMFATELLMGEKPGLLLPGMESFFRPLGSDPDPFFLPAFMMVDEEDEDVFDLVAQEIFEALQGQEQENEQENQNS